MNTHTVRRRLFGTYTYIYTVNVNNDCIFSQQMIQTKKGKKGKREKGK